MSEHPDPAPAPDPTEPRGVTRQDIFSVLGGLGAVLTLTTAVLYYFGWRRSYVQASLMGIDVSLFGFSSQDYVLRSISSLYLPLLVLLGIGLGWLRLHSWVVRVVAAEVLAPGPTRATASSWTRRLAVAWTAVAVACVLFAVAAGSSSLPPGVAWLADRLRDRQWVVPLALVFSTLTASYLAWIHQALRPPRPPVTRALWQTLLPIALITGTVVLGSFWVLEGFASAVGRGYAEQLAGSVGTLPRTVVISPAPLGIRAPGVTEVLLGAAGSADARYRTTGLRLLARSGGKVLLVHDGWNPSTGTVIVLADREDLSWQFSR